jgi:hypothetical protein
MAAAARGRVHALLVLNKDGSLVYYCDPFFAERRLAQPKFEWLREASTLFAMHQIAVELCPVPQRARSGIVSLEAGSFKVECFAAQTGVMFFAIADPDADALDTLLRDAYLLYCDFVMKSPFYVAGQPIKPTCELFDRHVRALVAEGGARKPTAAK